MPENFAQPYGKYREMLKKYPHYVKEDGEICLVLGGDDEPARPMPIEFTEKDYEDARKSPTMAGPFHRGPLYVNTNEAPMGGIPRFWEQRERRARQLTNALLRLNCGRGRLVLLTQDFANYQADSIWGLLKVYLARKVSTWLESWGQ